MNSQAQAGLESFSRRVLYETPDSLPWEGGFKKKKREQTCFASMI